MTLRPAKILSVSSAEEFYLKGTIDYATQKFDSSRVNGR